MLEPVLGSSINTNTKAIRLTVFLSGEVVASLFLTLMLLHAVSDPKDVCVKLMLIVLK